ncbi:ABC transporter permease [Glaciihabitans sp. UYNi722]|uniref:ABC transporter permease n=1 Tax=Glaciihabitans sp. UYNi722 TaxID=3156344 RepID=UPI0033913673
MSQSTASLRTIQPEEPEASTGKKILGWVTQQYALGILIVLLIIGASTTGAFLSSRNLSNLLLQTSVIGIVTLAQFLIILTGGIDISVGSVVGLAGVMSATLFSGGNVFVAILVAMAVGGFIGLINGYLVAFRGLEAFIVTLGMLSLARGLVYAITQGIPVTPSAPNFGSIANATILGFPVMGLIWLGIAALVAFAAHRTIFGRRVYAIGSSKDAARASGVPVKSTLLTVYVVAGVMVGFAGFLLTSQVGVATPTGGNLYELSAIAGVVIGGTRLAGGKGGVFGTVVGTLIFAVINNLLILLNVSTYLQSAFSGGLILVAVVFTTVRVGGRKKAR